MFWVTFGSWQTYAMTNRNGTKDCASALKCVAFAVTQNMISLIVVEFYLVTSMSARAAVLVFAISSSQVIGATFPCLIDRSAISH